jgi:type I restriction enzyme R subunit
LIATAYRTDPGLQQRQPQYRENPQAPAYADQVLTEEQERNVREQLTQEELTVFDILTRPGPDLSAEERDEVKKVARQMLDRLRALLVLDWRKRSSARARIRLAIEDTLDEGLPRAYSKELYNTKCEMLFEHMYESYQGDGRSVYADAR